jgi:hypothetical protein
MITATSGLILNHGWTGGYRFLPPGPIPPRPLPIEWAENTGKVLLYIIDGTVEWKNIVWGPMAELLLNGTIVDKENLTVEITLNGNTETVVFEPEDEDFYSVVVSSPTMIEKHPSKDDNSIYAEHGWKWDGQKFHQ